MTTVEEALRNASWRLTEAAIEEPRLEAEVLLAHLLQTDRTWLHLHHRASLESALLKAYSRIIERRTHHEPTAYITGEREFWSLRFSVSPATLIPRQETELLVETALSLAMRESWRAPRVLDLGTGSGVLAVTLAREWPGAWVVATDRSWQALRVAKANIKRHSVVSQVSLVQADVLQAFHAVATECDVAKGTPHLKNGTGFDLIVTNPPYVAEADIPLLAPEVVNFEPPEALMGGPDGLAVISRILSQTPGVLRPGGWLLCEIGCKHGTRVIELAKKGAYCHIEFRQDLSGLDRLLMSQTRP